MTQAVALAQYGSTGVSQGFKNRIINGAMVIDQRNAGASVNNIADSQYTLDRWAFQTNIGNKFTVQQDAGAVTPPAGFTDYLGVTSTSAYTVGSTEFCALIQRIEGYNVADLGFGTVNAKTITVSFWVRSSLTGTFGGTIANDNQDRTYPFNYTINSANTWEQKSVTIPGDTTGTWLTTNGNGLVLRFGIGCGSTRSGAAGAWTTSLVLSSTGATSVVGTNGATFYITGVQLEVGSTATSFDYRPYGTELQLCQRYYLLLVRGTDIYFSTAYYYGTTNMYAHINLPVTMRTAPTSAIVSGTNYYVFWRQSAGDYMDNLSVVYANSQNVSLQNTTEVSGTSGVAGGLFTGASASFVALQAEL